MDLTDIKYRKEQGKNHEADKNPDKRSESVEKVGKKLREYMSIK